MLALALINICMAHSVWFNKALRLHGSRIPLSRLLTSYSTALLVKEQIHLSYCQVFNQ